MSSQIFYMTIDEMAKALRSKELSALEITEAHLARIDSIDPQVGAFLTICADQAVSNAKKTDERISNGLFNSLTGIPNQIKDNISTKDIKTTCASMMLSDYIPPYNATVTQSLNDEGSILLGKGNMDEFAMGSSTENSAFKLTTNPWNSAFVPGGSSGGPAAAVSAGEVVFSLGSDTGGSIRQPAALCGVVGMKPTYGLVSRYGLVAFASSFDQIGPITRSVKDSAIVLSVIAGHDPRDSTSIPLNKKDYTNGIDKGVKGLKVGIAKEYFEDGIDPATAEGALKGIKKLQELGAEIVEISLPNSRNALAVYYIIAPSECSANLARYDGVKYGFSDQQSENMWEALAITRKDGFGPEVKRRIMLGTYALSAGYYEAYYLKAQKVRTLIRQEFTDAFEHVDIIATPSTPGPAFKIGSKVNDPVAMHANDICNVPVNIAGIPAISLPCGFVDGLPIGLQFLGPHLGEDVLFKAAFAYEQVSDWKKSNPIE